MGWLHAVPERHDKDDRRSRYDELTEAGSSLVELPEVESAEYLVNMFVKSGMCEHGAMGGTVALSWLELNAFNSSMGNTLTIAEVGVIRDMSKAYCKGYSSGSKLLSSPPFIADAYEVEKFMGKSIKDAIRASRKIRPA